MVGIGAFIVKKLQDRSDISDLIVEPDAESGGDVFRVVNTPRPPHGTSQ